MKHTTARDILTLAKAHKQVRHEDSEAILCFRLNTKRMFMIGEPSTRKHTTVIRSIPMLIGGQLL